MHRRLLILALLGTGLITAACSDERSPMPVEPIQPTAPSFSHVPPTALDMRTQIDALFPAGPHRLYARTLFGKIETLMALNPDVTPEELKRARLTAFGLVLFTVGRFHAGQLIGGKSDQTKGRVLQFILSLLRFVGFHNVPDLSPTVLSDDGIVAIVQPQGEQKVAPPSGDFMAVFFDNTVSQTTLVTGAQLQTATTPGTGPLPTDGTPQFPVFVRWTATNLDGSGAAKFNNSPTLMHCAVVEEAFHPHEAGNDFDNLRLGRRNPDNGTVQVFPAASQERLIALAAQINPATGRPYMSCENASTDIEVSSGGSGLLWLAQRGLKRVGGALVGVFAPKPLYAFTFLVGCDGGIELTGLSDWGIVHVNRPVEEVDLGATTTTLELGSSQTVTATLADGYELDPSKVDSKLTNPSRPGDPVTAFEQRNYTVNWSSSNNNVVSVARGDGHTAIITAHSAGAATITASIDGANATLAVTVLGIPDLVVSSGPLTITPSTLGTGGGSVTLSPLTFANQGDGAVGADINVDWGLYVSTDNVITTSDQRIPPFGQGRQIVTGDRLPAGGSYNWGSPTVQIPALAAGTYYVGVLIDELNTVAESNETNNYVVGTLTVAPAGPPFIASVVLNPTTLVIGGPDATSTVTLQNPGSSVENITLQGSIVQGATTRSAGSAAAFCGSGTGILPNGTCTMTFGALAFNGLPGTGTLVPGDASYVLNLRQRVPPFTVMDSETIPITLTAAGVDFVSVVPTTSPNCSSGNFFCYRDDVTLVATPYDALDNEILTGIWCIWTTGRGTLTPTITTVYPHTVVLSEVGNPGQQFFDVVVQATCGGVTESQTLSFEIDNW